jgi:hypothetical protein
MTPAMDYYSGIVPPIERFFAPEFALAVIIAGFVALFVEACIYWWEWWFVLSPEDRREARESYYGDGQHLW